MPFFWWILIVHKIDFDITMHELPWTKFSTGAEGIKKPADFVREYREEISKHKQARNRAGPREGFDAIANHKRQTDKLARCDELFLAAAETGNPEYARKALGKSGLNQMNNLRIYTAHKIATHGGGSVRQVTYEEAATFVAELLPTELRKEFPEKRIVTIRKETDRRSARKARKLKKLDNNREFPSTDFVVEIHEFADESIKACKGDPLALLKLSLCAIAAIRLPELKD
jgi:hypothetical protein